MSNRVKQCLISAVRSAGILAALFAWWWLRGVPRSETAPWAIAILVLGVGMWCGRGGFTGDSPSAEAWRAKIEARKAARQGL